jgi:hypothetical protein
VVPGGDFLVALPVAYATVYLGLRNPHRGCTPRGPASATASTSTALPSSRRWPPWAGCRGSGISTSRWAA